MKLRLGLHASNLDLMRTMTVKSVIGRFRIAVNLIMKARLSTKAFHMKISLFAYE